jgi:YVTN family beta-propeller protein
VLYAINYNATSVSLVQTETGQVSVISDAHMNYMGAVPRLAVAPDGGRAYIASNGSHSLVVIDTPTGHVVQVLQCSDVPNFGAAVALSSNGLLAFVTACDLSGSKGSVVVVNTATLPVTVIQALPVQQAPAAVAAAPDNVRFYVANQDSQSISVFQATLVGGVGNDGAPATLTESVQIMPTPSGSLRRPCAKRVAASSKRRGLRRLL